MIFTILAQRSTKRKVITMRKLHLDQISEWLPTLKAKEEILLSGTVYTARDAVHKRLMAALNAGEALPFPLENTAIYYAGPTPAKGALAIGACGPTTSSRMDPYVPRLFEAGLRLMIGKGDRSEDVYRTIKAYGGAYLVALGGAGALASACIKEASVIAYPELGCESVKRLLLCDFPLFVGIDAQGNSIFSKGDNE